MAACILNTCVFFIYTPFRFCLQQSIRQGFFLLGHSLSDLGVSDLLVDSGRLHFLQRTHNAVLLTPMGLNQWVHPVRVKHDVVGCHQQNPAHRTLKQHRKREGWVRNDGIHQNFSYMKEQLSMSIYLQKIIKSTSATYTTGEKIHLRPQMS